MRGGQEQTQSARSDKALQSETGGLSVRAVYVSDYLVDLAQLGINIAEKCSALKFRQHFILLYLFQNSLDRVHTLVSFGTCHATSI
jgi:hypothetical protein